MSGTESRRVEVQTLSEVTNDPWFWLNLIPRVKVVGTGPGKEGNFICRLRPGRSDYPLPKDVTKQKKK